MRSLLVFMGPVISFDHKEKIIWSKIWNTNSWFD